MPLRYKTLVIDIDRYRELIHACESFGLGNEHSWDKILEYIAEFYDNTAEKSPCA